jgi:glycosyltransferase involved in cell wall biosynthesis
MRICSPHCGIVPETTSGGETYERELLVRLAGLGLQIHLVLARGKPIPGGIANWTVHRLWIRRGLRWPVMPFVMPRAIKHCWDRHGFDILRAHSLRFIGPAVLWARRRYQLDVPVISHHHHLDPNWLNPRIEKRVIEHSDHVVTGSEFSRRQLARELGVRTEHVSVVAYGVDRKFAGAPPRQDLIARYGLEGHTAVLFFGGLKERKNVFLLLDIWREVAAVRPDARLVVAGGGPLLAPLRARARRLSINDRVVFTGYVPEAEKVAHYNLADIFLFPSAMEGFGLAVGEAMSCHLPAVASNRGSIPELLVDGEGGILCDPARPEEFVGALLRLISDAALREKFGRANRERVERFFRWEKCARQTALVYETVLEAWRRAKRNGPARRQGEGDLSGSP